jgi:hypothetical protein
MADAFRYFWFLAAAFMLVNILVWRRRLTRLVGRGVITKHEVDGFIRGALVLVVGGPLVAGTIGVLANWSSPLCGGFLSFADLPNTLMAVLFIVSWAALLWWLWRANGAVFLARISQALPPRPPVVAPSASMIRWGATLIVIINLVAMPFFGRVMPPDARAGCPGSRATTQIPTR